jgi:hypothetical protein
LRPSGLVFACAAALVVPAVAEEPPAATGGIVPNLVENVDRPLRYRPEGEDFVVADGAELFNRPLYGGHTAFRVDAGDRPELALYLPGRGGNLRLGLRRGASAKWLLHADHTVARYRPGTMRYEIRDALLGEGAVLRVEAVALHRQEALVVRILREGGDDGVEILFAYGGVTGERGRRDGDIGTEAVPIGTYFQLAPEHCRGNAIALVAGGFRLTSPAATIAGLTPEGATLAVADARRWDSPEALFGAAAPEAPPLVAGHAPLGSAPVFLGLERILDAPALDASTLPRAFDEAVAHFAAVRRQIAVETPDPYLDAAVGALNVAADAVWDEPSGTVQHGAVAWRTRLLGWRGPYAMDALGWHDRARGHLEHWAGRQNTDPIPAALPPPDETAHLARSEAALHSNGDLSGSHYDMNLVYVDALFRHLLWTGDAAFARRVWPVLERHLAWERRLFRRTFGDDARPLYEAYAAIWASDDLQYHGGGVAHASAYNYWHNRMAARIAPLAGADPAPYAREADAVARGMRELLWLDDRGAFGEFKDLLGQQRVHPSAAVWTFYHAMDAGLPTPGEAWRMARDVDRRIPHLPVRGPGVPEGLHVVSTTDWMPYTWSINNVVLSETVHTALGYWQAGRPDEAFRLTKGALLASMYMGICPGNVGSMNLLDVYRRESQRDFADPAGVLSRAIVEGLFGVRPDALAGVLEVAPGFPEAWERARLRHPRVTVAFARTGDVDRYSVETRFAEPQALRLTLRARRDRVASVTVGGGAARFRVSEAPSGPRVTIEAPAARAHDVVVRWAGRPMAPPAAEAEPAEPTPEPEPFDWSAARPAGVTWDPIDLAASFNDRLTRIFENEYRSPRSPYVSLAIPVRGLGGWAGTVNATADIDDAGLRAARGRLVLPNGIPFAPAADGPNVVFTSQWDNYPREARVALAGRARRLYLLMAGSTNAMQSRIDNGEVEIAYADGSRERLGLANPTTWWPIERDYFVDDFAFALRGPLPPRVDLRTGTVRLLDPRSFKGRGGRVPGGAATVLQLPLDPAKPLALLTVRALSNEVVIGLLAATLER